MSKLLIFLTLLGCDDSSTQCDVLVQPVPAFESRATCQVAAEDLLDRTLDRPYPVLIAKCGTIAETVAFLGTVTSPEAVTAANQRLVTINGR